MSLEQITLADGSLAYDPAFLSPDEAEPLLQQLSEQLSWRQDRIRLFGKEHAIPRLQLFMGEPGIRYRYSNLTLETVPWHPAVKQLKELIEAESGFPFNAVLLNLYRNGQDSMGWHSDDEPEQGQNPVIASVSLGETRRFLLRRKDNHKTRYEIALPNGSLLLMAGALQHFWQHSVPRTQKPRQPRINLTFRHVR